MLFPVDHLYVCGSAAPFVSVNVVLIDPLYPRAALQIELSAGVRDRMGTVLLSGTEAVVKLVQPVAVLVAFTVYELGAPTGPPTLMAVAEVPLLPAPRAAPPTAFPICH